MRTASLPTVRVLVVLVAGGGYLGFHVGGGTHPSGILAPPWTYLPLPHWDTHPETYPPSLGYSLPLDIPTDLLVTPGGHHWRHTHPLLCGQNG